MAGKWLTKSDYVYKYQVSPALLWLSKYAKEKLPPETEADGLRMSGGSEVGVCARQLFPGGRLVESKFQEAVAATLELVKAEAPAIFEAAVLTKRNLFAQADVLVKRGAAWDMYEVKSSAKVRSDHAVDLAFQKAAFEEAGFIIRNSYLIYINTQYERRGEVDPKQLFRTKDLTKAVAAIAHETEAGIEAALEVLNSPKCPDDGPLGCRKLGAWLSVYRYMHPELPPDTIYRLIRLNPEQVEKLSAAGITRIPDIPANFKPLNGQQRAQVELFKLGRPAAHKGRIKQELAGLEYPLYFLDYETVSPAIPLWEGTRPYHLLPFQYSLHIIDKPGAEPVQKEFLARGTGYPVKELLEHLSADQGPAGSVIVWFKDFEGGANLGMADLHPEYGDFLRGVNARIYDLMEIFSKNLYGHPDFFGSASIKNVLPVVVPEMTYKNLEIQEGMTASLKWLKAAKGELPEAEANKLYDDLLVYCGQDTLAMVKIYQFLLKLTG